MDTAVNGYKSCRDGRLLMPDCRDCIPGLSAASNCSDLSSETLKVRDSIMTHSENRFGKRSCYLYPYLSVPPLTERHIDIGQMITNDRPKRILDLGPYTNSILNFLGEGYCPLLVLSVEPCGEVVTNSTTAWMSRTVPCKTLNNHSLSTHVVVAPLTSREYMSSNHFRNTMFDAVVCIGCDSHYGPRLSDFNKIPRPFKLYLEYPPAYGPSEAAFNPEKIQSICGNSTTPSRKKKYSFDPKIHSHLAPHLPFSIERSLTVFDCNKLVLDKVECDPNDKTYHGAACRSEMHSLRHVQDPAFLTTGMKKKETSELIQTMPKRMNNCTRCDTILRQYDIYGDGWRHSSNSSTSQGLVRVPFNEAPVVQEFYKFSATLSAVSFLFAVRHRSKRWFSGLTIFLASFFVIHSLQAFKIESGVNTRERTRDAIEMLDYGSASYANKSVWNAFAAATVARRLLHSLGNQELLYRSVLDYNQYLAASVKTSVRMEYPSSYQYVMHECPPYMDTTYASIARNDLEPILPTGRSYGFTELNLLVDMFPFIVLPTFSDVSQRRYKRKILFDVGTNGFFGSAKSLIDMYEPFFHFDEVHLFEPDSEGMQIPPSYLNAHNISYHDISVSTGTRAGDDVLTIVRENVEPDDFVVLKYDVDEPGYERGVTMEWGFLADLMHSEEVGLVDELFIELHFYYKEIGWHKGYYRAHCMQQAYDVLRQLRQCGFPVHTWQ